MPMILTVVTASLALAGLVLGALTVRTWNSRNDPDYLRDVVHHGVVAFLKIGLLLALVCFSAIAVVGGLAAHRGNVAIPAGVWGCAVLSWLIAAGFVISFARRLRARA